MANASVVAVLVLTLAMAASYQQILSQLFPLEVLPKNVKVPKCHPIQSLDGLQCGAIVPLTDHSSALVACQSWSLERQVASQVWFYKSFYASSVALPSPSPIQFFTISHGEATHVTSDTLNAALIADISSIDNHIHILFYDHSSNAKIATMKWDSSSLQLVHITELSNRFATSISSISSSHVIISIPYSSEHTSLTRFISKNSVIQHVQLKPFKVNDLVKEQFQSILVHAPFLYGMSSNQLHVYRLTHSKTVHKHHHMPFQEKSVAFWSQISSSASDPIYLHGFDSLSHSSLFQVVNNTKESRFFGQLMLLEPLGKGECAERGVVLAEGRLFASRVCAGVVYCRT